MADSWGFIIIFFFLAAVVVFIIKLFVEYPGLLQLACIYKEDSKRGEKLEKFQKPDKNIVKNGQSDKIEHLGKNSQTKEKLESRITYLEEKIRKKDATIKSLESKVNLLSEENNKKKVVRYETGILKPSSKYDKNDSKIEKREENIEECSIENDDLNDTIHDTTSLQCKELKLLNSKINFV